MLNKKKEVVLGIIAARGTSKGLANKNMKLLRGRPLIEYSIDAALRSKVLDKIIVSTDSLKIAEFAKAKKIDVPFLRPASLARDDTLMLDVLRHAIRFMEQKNAFYPDIIVLLQPTSPLRQFFHIREGLEKLIRSKADSVISLSEAEHSPYWMKKLAAKDRVKPFITDKNSSITLRQKLPRVYRINGALYITRRDVIIRENRILGKDARAIIMAPEDSVDIDTMLDFQLAELILKKRLCKR